MKKRNYLPTIIAFLFLNVLQSQTFIQRYADIANQVSQSNITTNLTEYEALGVKRRGTAALQNTLDWLKNKYTSFGYSASQMTEDSYTYSGSTAVCKNLIITKVGTVYPNTYVIVCGHYDSIVGTGTNDNGSGVVSILEMARLLQNVPTEYSIKFINFSGEEDGLKGSQHFVSSVVNGTTPKMDIRLVFNLDEVGGVAGLTNNNITCERDTNNSPSTNNAVSATFTNELITCVGYYSPLQTTLSYAYASDYMPFQANNEIITGFFETNETSHKHSATDLLVNMDPVYNFNVAKAATGAILHFAKAETALSTTTIDQDFQVSFYPNPAKDSLHINIGVLKTTEYKVSVVDSNGKVVLVKEVKNPKLIETLQISSLSKGMYLVQLQSEDKQIFKKILID
ncbi:M20/M25/M40 family metallo-hydrolase [Flavobacterium amnicola]|uniref:M20/M25/M40 family metallo-hydrolase n=1 Tax=Flavobacterium amnicola TaxID=2506422 RepID=A0A4Q1K2C7_9FLAO|nr:M20/M25/M40 family metallo-hydrolase [Flavobacterium amnicola]RXR19193.1 M20/M25/M40 family metallo-hydrolase [Flavobacterium amnicola]